MANGVERAEHVNAPYLCHALTHFLTTTGHFDPVQITDERKLLLGRTVPPLFLYAQSTTAESWYVALTETFRGGCHGSYLEDVFSKKPSLLAGCVDLAYRLGEMIGVACDPRLGRWVAQEICAHKPLGECLYEATMKAAIATDDSNSVAPVARSFLESLQKIVFRGSRLSQHIQGLVRAAGRQNGVEHYVFKEVDVSGGAAEDDILAKYGWECEQKLLPFAEKQRDTEQQRYMYAAITHYDSTAVPATWSCVVMFVDEETKRRFEMVKSDTAARLRRECVDNGSGALRKLINKRIVDENKMSELKELERKCRASLVSIKADYVSIPQAADSRAFHDFADAIDKVGDMWHFVDVMDYVDKERKTRGTLIGINWERARKMAAYDPDMQEI